MILDEKIGMTNGRLMTALDERGIDALRFFHSPSSLREYAELPRGANARRRNKDSYRMSPYAVNLPSALTLTEARSLMSVVACEPSMAAKTPPERQLSPMARFDQVTCTKTASGIGTHLH